MNNANGDPAKALSLSELLEDGVFVDGDWVESRDQDSNGEVRLIQLADIGDGAFRNRSSRFLTIEKAKELRCTFLEPGDILVARMPDPLGRACVFPGVGQPAVTAVDVCILRPNPERARADWLVNAINAPHVRSAMEQHARGTTRQRISRKNLGKVTLPVPGLDVQAAVAVAVDRVETKRHSAARHVASARIALERFRRAVLAAACSGRLTADWREDHPGKGANDLQPRAEQRRRAQRARFVEPQLNPHISHDELPETWTLVPLGLVLDDLKYGTSKRSAYDAAGIPVLRIPNVSAGVLDVEGLKFADFDDREREALKLLQGDLLMIRSNGSVQLVGVTVSVTAAAVGMAYAGYLMRLRVDREFLDPEFLRLVLASPQLRHQIELPARSTSGVHNINTQEVRGLGVPVPSQEEQEEIVRRATAALGMPDRLASRIEGIAATLDQVPRATLAKAFQDDS